MIRRMRRTIRRRRSIGNYKVLVASGTKSNIREKQAIDFFGAVPTERRYVVRYTLNESGRYFVKAVYGIRFLVGRRGHSFPVCFLPKEWVGKRASRETWRVK